MLKFSEKTSKFRRKLSLQTNKMLSIAIHQDQEPETREHTKFGAKNANEDEEIKFKFDKRIEFS